MCLWSWWKMKSPVSIRHTSGCTHQSTRTGSNKSSRQNFVVELKTLFFWLLFFFFVSSFLFFLQERGRAWGWFYLQTWLKITKNFSSFSNDSLHVIFMYSSNSLCFPFVSRYFSSTAKNTSKVCCFFQSVLSDHSTQQGATCVQRARVRIIGR